MKRYCDYCNRRIPSDATVFELRIENEGAGVLERETLCRECLSEKY